MRPCSDLPSRNYGGFNMQPDRQLLTMHAISELVKHQPPHVYRLIRRGEFPAPIKIGRASRWLSTEIDNWLEQRLGQRAISNPSKE
jgi:prophage regulatory protein